jgi:lysophospholipase L1-like esterase
VSLAVKLLLTPVLVAQALRTRARLPRLLEATGARQGVAGRGQPGAPLRLLLTGDSSAAGVGVATQREALAGQLTQHLAAQLQRPVHWRLLAQRGLTTAQTLHLLQRQDAATLGHFDVAVVMTGVNDVVEQVPSTRAVRHREALANHLRNAGGVQHVVFVPLPPLHQFPGLPQPLRWVAGSDARRHDQALRDWAATRDDVTRVDLDLQLNRGVMASDGFHPGAKAYRQFGHDIAAHLATLFAAPAAA